MTVFETTFFIEFLLAFLFGISAGYITHSLVRAPLWLVQKITE